MGDNEDIVQQIDPPPYNASHLKPPPYTQYTEPQKHQNSPVVTICTQPSSITSSPPVQNRYVKFGRTKQFCRCAYCHMDVITDTIDDTSTADVFAVCLCCFGCCPCICIPYFMDSCKAVNHYCPNCKHLLATVD